MVGYLTLREALITLDKNCLGKHFHETIEWNIDLDIIEMSNCTKYPINILSLGVS